MDADEIRCQWPNGCKKQALHFIANSDMSQSLYLCSAHRRTAIVNLESKDKVFIGDSKQELKPNSPISIKKEEKRPNWEQEAAKKADSQEITPEEFEKKRNDALAKLIGVELTPRKKKS